MGQPHPEKRRTAVAEGPPLVPRSDEVRTLPQWLMRAATSAENAGLVFVAADGSESSCSYSDLLTSAKGRLAALQARGLTPGERAILLARNTVEFVELFWGCLLGGVVPVLLPPPKTTAESADLALSSEVQRLAAVWQRLDCPAVIVPEPWKNLHTAMATISCQQVDRWWTPAQLQGSAALARMRFRAPNSTAFLLFSSGSTREPQGVRITHDNVWANVQATSQHNEFTSTDATLCWAPLHHVIGLVCFHLLPVYNGARQVMLEPSTLLKRPELWFEKISKHRVTYTGGPNFAFSQATNRIADDQLLDWDLSCVRVLLNGGEVVSVGTLKRFHEKFGKAGLRAEALAPAYGMSESAGGIAYPSVDQPLQTLTLEHRATANPAEETTQDIAEVEYANLGSILPGISLRIVDEANRPVDEEVVGNIQARGRTVTPGYEGNESLTKESFVDDWLRTGDIGFLRGGQLAVVGRTKDVIIAHGHNYYAHDLEQAAREVAGVVADRIVAIGEFREELGREHLVLFIALQGQTNQDATIRAIEEQVLRAVGLRLDRVIVLSDDQFPRTLAGKIHRYELKRQFVAGDFDASQSNGLGSESGTSNSEKKTHDLPTPVDVRMAAPLMDRVIDFLARNIAGVLAIDVEHIDPQASFVELGIDSVLAVQLVRDLEDRLSIQLPTTLAYDHPNLRALAEFLCETYGETCSQTLAQQNETQRGKGKPGHGKSAGEHRTLISSPHDAAAGSGEEGRHQPIAIVGMSARLPGAKSLDQFWMNLSQGICSIREIPPERWDVTKFYSPRPGLPGKTVSKWAGLLDEVDRFDARLFGISPHEAQRMDPQQRMLMEVCWETLEAAGYGAGNLAGSDTGVFVGISLHDYMRGLLRDSNTVDAYVASGNFLSIAANRLSYVLDLKGPSMAVDTACSSSLVALHLAVNSLRRGECHAAIVGTAHLHFTPELYINFSQAGMLSPDGRLKAFDRRANGYVRGEGVAAVMLKPLSDARRDGDFIHAIIRGTAVNQDGRTNGLTAPNRESQVQVIRQAHRDAGVDSREISYVEAHGTGTVLGDPIELRALAEVFANREHENSGDSTAGHCGIGSVKTNLGHLEPASGLASLIKVVLSLEHQQLAPTLNFEQPSDHVRFEKLPIYVVDRVRRWPRGSTPRIAGVSAFGFGGTNAHVVVQEAPESIAADQQIDGPFALTLSAQTPAALSQLANDFADHLETHGEQSLADVCFTTNTGRRKHQHRAAIIADSRVQMVYLLRSLYLGSSDQAAGQQDAIFGDIKDKTTKSRLVARAIAQFENLDEESRQRFWKCCNKTQLSESLKGHVDTAHSDPGLDLAKSLLTLLCLVDCAGLTVDWASVGDAQVHQRVPLPTYPFQRQHFPLIRQEMQDATHEQTPADFFSSDEAQPVGRTDTPRKVSGDTLEEIAARIRAELATALGISPEEVELDTNYTELGLDSIMATRVASRLDPDERYGLDALLLFTYPTVSELANYLQEECPGWCDDPQRQINAGTPVNEPDVAEVAPTSLDDERTLSAPPTTYAVSVKPTPTSSSHREDIAIVGMACRMPGASSPEALWEILRDGRNMVGPLPASRRGLHPAPPGNFAQGGFLADVAGFDPEFFGLTLRQARLIDPQQRLMLEVAWQSVQSSGHRCKEITQARTGVFVGVAHNDYEHILHEAARRHDAQYSVGNAASMVANRVSYTLNLTGPSLSIDTACSSSLVAVHMACSSLLSGETDWAIAGGVNLILWHDDTQALDAAGMLSCDARSMAFDNRANGYVRGEGAGAVLLRPLSAALADGDPVLAVIRGSAVNHDGHSKVGITAPNPKAQRRVLEEAYRRGEIDTQQVSLLEAHGTGTRLGDPIEVQALNELFTGDKNHHSYCALGSVKSNLGHLEAAAGIAGLIKAVLALRHRALPPTLHVETPNRHVAWTSTPFYVNERLRLWETEGPRYAGVSSFGAGGTNAHVVLEEGSPVSAESQDRVGSLPTDPFQRQHCWVDVSFSNEAGLQDVAEPPKARSTITPEPSDSARLPDEHQAVAEQWLLSRLSEVLEIPPESIDPTRPVVEAGLDSMLATQVSRLIEAHLGKSVSQTICFDYPTVQQLAAALVEQFEFGETNEQLPLQGQSPVVETPAPKKSLDESPIPQIRMRSTSGDDRRIAIVGIGGRFPDASTIEDFWQNLAIGHDSVREIPPDRWLVGQFFDADRSLAGKTYSKWGAMLEHVDRFDAPLFHISPREAAAMDPQQRLLLEVAWETLERAGYAGGRLAGTRTGVFVGTMASEYLPRLLEHPTKLGTHVGTGNAASVIANRLSYLMNFKGPCLSIDTACSSSLVALHLAVESLRRGECDCALVGATQAALAVSHYQVMSRLGALSPTGRCRTFDRSADGYVLGEGVGMVMLKPLTAAIADRDHIEAVILGSATNHSGQAAGLTVPNADSQAEVIREALADANATPASISYLEAHGTGTGLGDPIEFQGLNEVFAGHAGVPQSCGLGSVKTNIGHAESAAGIAGLLKVVLSLQHGQLPPTLHLVEPNRHLAFERSPFYVNDRLIAWPQGSGPRRAGVSAFGFGGTNAHVVVEEAPPQPAEQGSATPLPERAAQLLLLSARDQQALDALSTRWSSHLAANPSLSVGDVTYTAATGREHFAERMAVVGRDTSELAQRLRTANQTDKQPTRGVWRGSGRRPKVAALFSGQGAQYAGMGRVLYDTQPVFREAWEASAAVLSAELDEPLQRVLESDEPAAGLLSQTAYTQPALFALQHALWQLWQSWGLEVEAVVGHSVGEYAAACAAGVLSWSDGAQLVARRARLMQALPGGGTMAAVLASRDVVEPHLARYGDTVAIAAINSAQNTVISGETTAIESLLAEFRTQNIASQRLEVSHAFHSSRMEPVLESLRTTAAGFDHHSPQRTWVTNLTGTPWTIELGSLPEYWARQARQTVRFSDCVKRLVEDGFDTLLELGPGTTLTSLASQVSKATHVERSAVQSIASLRRGRDDWHSLSEAAAQLYTQGADLDWEAFHHPHARRRLPLPTYAFQRQRYWVDDQPDELTSASVEQVANPNADPDSDGWLHELRWRRVENASSCELPSGTWLIVDHSDGIGRTLVAELNRVGCQTILASVGSTTNGPRIITLEGSSGRTEVDNFAELFNRTPQLDGIITIAAHQANPTRAHAPASLDEQVLHQVAATTEFLAALARSPELPAADHELPLWSVTFGSHAVTDADTSIDPASTAVVGLMRTARLELGGIDVRIADLPFGIESPAAASDISRLLASDSQHPELAMRDGVIWEPGVEPGTPGNCPPAPELPEDGVYLITGGLGGLGLGTARMLADRGCPRLVLISRRPPTPEQAGVVEALQKQCAEVLVVNADVANRNSLNSALQRVREHFGSLDGIFHAAGVADDALLRNVEPASLRTALQAKVNGTILLDELTRDDPPSRFVLYGSLAALAGNVGQAAYAAANAFLDGYAAARREDGGQHFMSIDWGPWSEVGMAADPSTAQKLESAGLSLIDPPLGRRLLALALNQDFPQAALFKLTDRALDQHTASFRPLSSLNSASVRKATSKRSEFGSRVKESIQHLPVTTEVATAATALVREAFSEVLDLPSVEIDDHATFRDLGVDSLLAEEAIDALRHRLGLPSLATAVVYEYPTVAALAVQLAEQNPQCFARQAKASKQQRATTNTIRHPEVVSSRQPEPSTGHHDIAIVGYACRFPGCDNAAEYWEVLRDGVDCVTAMPQQRWEIAQSYDPGLVEQFGGERPRGGFLRDVQSFDAQLFRISPAEVRQMDPRQRLFLEVAYRAAEHAGYGGTALSESRCGVYAGCGANDYLLDVPSELLSEHSATGSTAASLPGRLAYYLNLRGPCLPIDTACSSSLVALHLACESLRRGECRFAFAGGVHLHLRLGGYHALRALGALSPDGQCRPFDEQANGFVPAEGAGVVLLRPLSDALNAGDRIYGVIKGSAVNNDGRTNGLTAPSPQAQVEVLQSAWQDANVEADTISYIEAHGTGTVLGDPIEAQALTTAFESQTARKHFCGLGSLKSNMGHLDAAAGMASLIKVLLSFEHDLIPPTLHVTEPNSRIRLDGPLSLVTSARTWLQGTLPRRAGISAFGFSGTNAHVVVEEPPQPSPEVRKFPPFHLLTLSANDPGQLQELRQEYAYCIEHHPDFDLADVCCTAAVGRWHLSQRLAIVAPNGEHMVLGLRGITQTAGEASAAILLESTADETERGRQLERVATLFSKLPATLQRLVATCCSGPAVQEVVQRSNHVTVSWDSADAVSGKLPGEMGTWKDETWKQVFEVTARLYVLGADVDFESLQAGDHRRVPLPPTPLRRERCWLPLPQKVTRASFDSQVQTVEARPESDDRLFHELTWQLEPLDRGCAAMPGRVLLIQASDPPSSVIIDRLVSRLRTGAAEVYQACFGERFANLGDHQYEFNPRSSEDIGSLLDEVAGADSPLHVVYLAGYGMACNGDIKTLDDRLDRGVRGVFRLARALDRLTTAKSVSVTVVTQGAVAIRQATECTSPEASAMWGMLKVAALELPHIKFRAVDLAPSERDRAAIASDINHIVDELSHDCESSEIAYRNGQRFASHVRPTQLAIAEQDSFPLKNGGVYLITGGLGGIGLAVARWLAERYSARLVLVGRTPLADNDSGSGEAAEVVANLRWSATDLWHAAADVTDREAMSNMFAEARRRYGRIDGVFHCAGVIQRARLRDMDVDSFESVLRPKVQGTLVLDELMRADPRSFLVLFSSVAGLDGNVFQGDYSAASRFLDSFAAWRTAQGRPSLSIDWGLWSEVGMGAQLAKRLADRPAAGLSTATALAALEQALASGRHHVVIDAARSQRDSQPVPRGGDQGRSSWIPRVAQIEQAVTTWLASVLETDADRLDRRTGFLDFGLDSMLALKLVRRLEEATEAQLPATLPFDYPTIEALSARLIAVIPSEGLRGLVEPSEHRRSDSEDRRERGSEARSAAGSSRLSRPTSVLRSVESAPGQDFAASAADEGRNGNRGPDGQGRQAASGLILKTGRCAIVLQRKRR